MSAKRAVIALSLPKSQIAVSMTPGWTELTRIGRPDVADKPGGPQLEPGFRAFFERELLDYWGRCLTRDWCCQHSC